MALSTSIWSTLFDIVDKLDLNTSEIEKIETKFRIARKVNIWIISPIFLITALVLSYYIAIWVGSNITKYFVLIMIASIIIEFILLRKHKFDPNKKSLLYWSTFLIYLTAISTTVMTIGYILAMSILPIRSFFSWAGLGAIALLIILILGCYFNWKLVNLYLARFPKLFSVNAIKKPILYITTSNNSSYICTLLNITKRGDYIIQPLNSQNDFIDNEDIETRITKVLKVVHEEILLNRLHIVDIKYLGELQSLNHQLRKDVANEFLASIEKNKT